MNQAKLEIVLRLKDEATKGLKRATRSLEAHQAQFRKGALLMAGAAGIVGAALFAAARAGRDQANALDALQGAVDRTGVKFNAVESRIKTMAKEIANVSNFTETDVIEAFRHLVSMTGDVDKAFKFLGVTMDVAAEKNVGMETAARNVVNAVLRGAGELVETYVPALKDTADEAERLTMVEDAFTGALEANADPLKIATSAVTDLLAAFQIWPIITEALEALGDFADILRDRLSEKTLKGIGKALIVLFATLTASATLLGIAAMTKAIVGIGAAFWGLAAAAGAAGVAVLFTVGPFALIGALIALAVAAIVLAFKDWDKFQSNIAAFWGTIGGIIISGLVDARKKFDTFWEDVWAKAIPIAKTIAGRYVDAIVAVWDGIKAIGKAIGSSFASGLSAGLEGVKATVNNVIDMFNHFIRYINKISFKIPSWAIGVPGRGKTIGFDLAEIPKLAAGGIVTKPTLAVLGERGPEAIIPLGRRGGIGLVVNIVMPTRGTVILDNERSVRALVNELMPHIRTALRTQSDF